MGLYLSASSRKVLLPPSLIYSISRDSMAPFPDIKSKHSLVATHVTEAKWAKLGDHVTKTSGFTLAKAIACAVEFDNQHCGIFHNADKTFLVWVNEEDQLRIISMQGGGDVRAVFDRLARGIKAVGDSVKAESGRDFMLDPKYGYIHSCPTNLGTGMRASVHVDLPGWTKEGVKKLQDRCEELHLQPRGTRGESGGQTGITYDISNKHRLGYSEVELIQKMIDGVNTLVKEDRELAKKHSL